MRDYRQTARKENRKKNNKSASHLRKNETLFHVDVICHPAEK